MTVDVNPPAGRAAVFTPVTRDTFTTEVAGGKRAMTCANHFLSYRDRTVTAASNYAPAVVICVSGDGQSQKRALKVVSSEPATALIMMTASARTGQKDMYQPFKRETIGPRTAAAIAAPMPPHTRGWM